MEKYPQKVSQIFNLDYANWLGLRQLTALTSKGFSEVVNEALKEYLAKEPITKLELIDVKP